MLVCRIYNTLHRLKVTKRGRKCRTGVHVTMIISVPNGTFGCVHFGILVNFTFESNVCIILQIERRLENVRLVFHNVHKKMGMCLQGNVGSDVDKRHVSNSCFYISNSLHSAHFWIVVFFLLEKASSHSPFTIHAGWRKSARRRVLHRVSLWTLWPFDRHMYPSKLSHNLVHLTYDSYQ